MTDSTNKNDTNNTDNNNDDNNHKTDISTSNSNAQRL